MRPWMSMRPWMIVAPVGLALVTAACGDTREQRAGTGALGGAAAGAVVGGPVGAAVGAGVGAAGGAYREEAEEFVAERVGDEPEPAAQADAQTMQRRQPMEQQAMTGGPTNQEVREAQQALKQMGYYEGQIDGLFGRRTIRAVSEFQQQRDMAATGELDPRTMEALTQQAAAGGGQQDQTQPDASQQQQQQQQLGQQPDQPAGMDQTDQPRPEETQRQDMQQEQMAPQGQTAQ